MILDATFHTDGKLCLHWQPNRDSHYHQMNISYCNGTNVLHGKLEHCCDAGLNVWLPEGTEGEILVNIEDCDEHDRCERYLDNLKISNPAVINITKGL